MDKVDIWAGSVTAAMTTLWSKLASFAPNLFGSIVILLLGYLIARIVAAVLHRLFKAIGIDAFSQRAGVTGMLGSANIERPLSHILARIVFWILMLTFLVSATETLGLDRVSATVNSLVQYLPKVLGAIFMLLIGLFVAGFLRDVIRTAASGIGFEYASSLGTAAYALLVVIVVSLAIGQLELETAILTQAISIVLMSAGAAAALAFGLGSREVAANVLSATYVREIFAEGDHVDLNGVEGRVKSVGPVTTLLAVDGREISVPNATLLTSITKTERASS